MKSSIDSLRSLAVFLAVLALVLLPIETKASGPDKIPGAHDLMAGDQKEGLVVADNTTEGQVSRLNLRLQATPQKIMIMPGSSFSPTWARWSNSKQGCHYFACKLSDDDSMAIAGNPGDDIRIPLGRDDDQLFLRLPELQPEFAVRSL